MPLRTGKSRAVISSNIREMVAAGHPKKQAVAAALRTADQTKGKPKMAKHGKHHALSGHGAGGDDGVMGGAAGMSPRKAMASGKGDGGGNFGVEAFEHGAIGHAGQHPDARAMTGAKPHLADHERAIGKPIEHTKDHHPAQAAPSHGPHHPGGHMRHEHGRFHDMAGKHKAG